LQQQGTYGALIEGALPHWSIDPTPAMNADFVMNIMNSDPQLGNDIATVLLVVLLINSLNISVVR
jgi:hypothetical protein